MNIISTPISFYESINNYTSKENLIINQKYLMGKNSSFWYINYKKKLITLKYFLSLDEFVEKIFLPKKNVLKDIKRF